jgi:DNA-binding NarL/FixJ family response regulator
MQSREFGWPGHTCESRHSDGVIVTVTTHSTRVVLVDDHPAMRAGVRGVLEKAHGIDVVGEAATGEEALSVLERTSPDVVFLDIGLPDVDGISLLDEIKKISAHAKIVMFSCQTGEASVRMTLDAGVNGYLTKLASPREIVDAVRRVCRGQVAMSADVVTHLVSGVREKRQTGASLLTTRESEVWAELAKGLSNKEIARVLFLSEHTVKFHVHNLLRKLGLKSRAEAIYAAHRQGVALR